MYQVITPATTELVTLSEAKQHLRVDDTSDDALITSLITVAREFAEHYTGKSLVPVTLEMTLPRFPLYSERIALDAPPVTSVTSIKYTDTAGIEQTVDPANYTLSPYGDSREIRPAYQFYWPITQCIADAVRIRYVAGYMAPPGAVVAAALLLIGHLYENRQTVSALKLSEVPLGALALLNVIKVWAK